MAQIRLPKIQSLICHYDFLERIIHFGGNIPTDQLYVFKSNLGTSNISLRNLLEMQLLRLTESELAF